MDLATVLLLHKSSFIVGAICFFYVRWRSGATPGLGVLAVGFTLLAIASTVFEGNQVTPSVSAGVALWEADLTEQDVQKRADQALYIAKNKGRNRVELFSSVGLTSSVLAPEPLPARAG
ncbi:GGDEF domain-containing protein [Rhizobium leguminosarum]|uniref:GGDEF domain-containing protein n=1 Tax=Rhizobium leguminosarum TaxID=384 RepID=A0ACD5FAN9_RHILE|nr:diguanylate cyclase [Rhizobium leguminosarum]